MDKATGTPSSASEVPRKQPDQYGARGRRLDKSPQKVLKPQNQHAEGAEAQLGLVDSWMGVPGASAHPLSGSFANTHSVSQLPGRRIFIQKQELKKLYRVSAAENSALPPCHSPSGWAVPPLWVALCQAQPVHSSQKGISGSSRNLQGGGERSMAPSNPQPCSLIPTRGQ